MIALTETLAEINDLDLLLDKILTTARQVVRADAGSIYLRDGQALRMRVGMQLQQSNLPDRMRVWEALDLYSSFYPNPVNWETLLEQLGLQEKRNAPFAN